MLYIIANLHAGYGRARHSLDKVEKHLKKKQVPYSVLISQYAGHSIELARSVNRSPENIVAALGGDGTVAEVAQGLLNSEIPMGIIPAGSGNDYRRCHKIPGDPVRAVELILRGKVLPIDAIEANGRTFLNIINIGLDNEVATQAYRFKRFGKLAYLFTVFYVVPYYKNKIMRITIGEKTIEQKILLMCAGCGTHYGGGMHALPTADPTDGLLDICIINDMPKSAIYMILPLYIMGLHTILKSLVTFYRAREINIECLEEVVAIGGDGEIMNAATPAHLKVLPGAINLLV